MCVRSVSRKSRDLDALGSREVIVVMKVAIVVRERERSRYKLFYNNIPTPS